MPSLLGDDPRILPNQRNTYTPSGGLLDVPKGVASGLLGFPADMIQLMMQAQAGANRFPQSQVPQMPFTSEKIGGLLGANTQSDTFNAGLIGAPDPGDIARLGTKGLLAQALFHGTPHKFDKFDLKAIGTGEGAQAYGHGLYFAESPGVAGSYKPSGQTIRYRGEKIDPDFLHTVNAGGRHMDVNFAVRELVKADGDVDVARKSLLALADEKPSFARAYKSAADKVDDVGSNLDIENAGHLYEVDLPDETIAKMLDWDAPLSEQPESVRKALQSILQDNADVTVRPNGPVFAVEGGGLNSQNFATIEEAQKEATRRAEAFGRVKAGSTRKAESAYKELSKTLGSDEAASKALQEAGIPGIRFFDGNSRNSKVTVSDKSLHRLSGGVAENYLSTANNNVDAAVKKLRSDIASMPESGRKQFIDAANGLEAGTITPSATRNIVVFNPDDISQVKRDGELVYKAKGL